MLSLVGVSYSAEKQVAIVTSKSSEMYIEIADVVETQLKTHFAGNVEVIHVNLLELELQNRKLDWNNLDLAISVGTKAAKWLATTENKSQKNELQRLFIFVPKLAITKILKLATPAIRDKSISIYLDQPFSRELNLTKLLLTQVNTVGVVIGPLSQSLKTELSKLGKTAGIQLLYSEVEKIDDGYANIRAMFSKSNAILTIPDPVALSPQRTKWLLYQSYQKKVPIISFSQSLVNAGALAAVYSSPHQIGQQAGEVAIDILNARLPSKHHLYPKYFDVAINRAVARSLGLENVDKDTLVKTIRGLNNAGD